MQYESERFYGLNEISADLRIPQSSLQRWAREGKIKAVTFGKKWMVDGAEVERLRREGVPNEKQLKA